MGICQDFFLKQNTFLHGVYTTAVNITVPSQLNLMSWMYELAVFGLFPSDPYAFQLSPSQLTFPVDDFITISGIDLLLVNVNNTPIAPGIPVTVSLTCALPCNISVSTSVPYGGLSTLNNVITFPGSLTGDYLLTVTSLNVLSAMLLVTLQPSPIISSVTISTLGQSITSNRLAIIPPVTICLKDKFGNDASGGT